MRNYISPGVNVTLPAPATILPGDFIVIGSLFGVASQGAATGEEFDLVTRGVFELPKVSALAISIGDKVYWDSTAKLVTKTASGNTLIGIAVTGAPNPSATVQVRVSN